MENRKGYRGVERLVAMLLNEFNAEVKHDDAKRLYIKCGADCKFACGLYFIVSGVREGTGKSIDSKTIIDDIVINYNLWMKELKKIKDS